MSLDSDRVSADADAARSTRGFAGGWVLGSEQFRERIRDFGIIAAFVILFVALTISSSDFATPRNLQTLVDQYAGVGIMACAGTFVFIAGGFDLSVAGILGVSALIAAKLEPTLGVNGALLAGILAGLAFGLINGILVSLGRINAFVATLGTSIILAGIAQVISVGSVVLVDNTDFTWLGQGSWLGLSNPTWVWILVTIGSIFLLRWTAFGRYVFAVGDNVLAARLAGVRVRLVQAATFALSGAAAGLAGVIDASRSGAGDPATASSGIALTVIAAIVIGGTSIMGGEGAIWRTIIGVLILAMIGNGLALLNVSASTQNIVQGAILLVAVGADAWSRVRAP